jgi:hypothetical protein
VIGPRHVDAQKRPILFLRRLLLLLCNRTIDSGCRLGSVVMVVIARQMV